jgi:hypothetical protein
MTNVMNLFKIIILIQLLYGIGITGYTQILPEDSLNYVTSFSDLGNEIDFNTISSEVEDSLERQTNIPVIELGALVFYSGNILIDLIMNFAFAIPQMLILLMNGIFSLMSVDAVLLGYVQLFISTTISVLYLIGIIELLTGLRSGRSIA